MRLSAPWRGTGHMGTRSDLAAVTVIVATRLEAWAVRRAVRGERIIEAGVGLGRLPREELGGVVVTCGLAGAVRPGLPTGSVIIPEKVLRPDGRWLSCDPSLVTSLVAGARNLGLEPDRGPLGTASTLVRGAARASWAARGCGARAGTTSESIHSVLPSFGKTQSSAGCSFRAWAASPSQSWASQTSPAMSCPLTGADR